MPRSERAFACFAALLLLTAACTAAASPTPTAEPTASPTPSASPSPTPTATPSPSPTPTADASAAECDPDESTAESEDWLQLESLTDNFTLLYPDDWNDVSGIVQWTTGTQIDEETLAETGLDAEGTTLSDTVLDVEGTPSLTVIAFEPVESDLDDVAARQLERIEDLEELEELIDADLEACVGGEDAIGFELSFTAEAFSDTGQPEETGEVIYQRSWWLVRDDTAYHVQWLDLDDEGLDVLEEILATWEWTDEPAEVTDGRIVDAAMAAEVDTSASEPDPDWFTETFSSDASVIYVVFSVESDDDETVNLTFRTDGELIADGTFAVPAGSPWAYFSIPAPSGGFPPGDYEVELEVEGSGDTEMLTFTVE